VWAQAELRKILAAIGENGYSAVDVDGIPLRDRVRSSLALER